jgi:hypothetical protein
MSTVSDGDPLDSGEDHVQAKGEVVAGVPGLGVDAAHGRRVVLGGLLASQIGLTAPFWFGAITGSALPPLVWRAFSPEALVAARNATM